MSNELIKNLLEALEQSPSNVPLRLQVAQMLLGEKRYQEASDQFREVLQQSYGNTKAQLGLARCYFHLTKYSAAIIIYEQLENVLSEEDQVFNIKCLIRERSMEQAIAIYRKLLLLQPNFKDDEIDSHLRASSSGGPTAFGSDDESIIEIWTLLILWKSLL